MTSSPSKTPLDDLLVGHVVGERYVIEAMLGEGGVGRVYRARHTALNRSVALKVLLAEHEGSEVLRERFRREAEALAALSHPHIVAVTDFGVDGDMLFLVMELLEGRSLAELLREAPLEPKRALAIMRQILLGLGYAHARSVVHRDLKPHNVFVRTLDDGSDHATVLDFGLARAADDGRPRARLTRTGMILGTPAYMPPEQASGDVDAIDARSDVYAAGLVLYELLARRRPFLESDPGKLLRAHLLDEPPPLASVAPGLTVPSELQAIVSRALAKSRSERFADATEMLAALDAIDPGSVRRDRASVTVGSGEDDASMASAVTLAAPDVSPPRAASPQARPRASRVPLIAGAIAALFALAIAATVIALWIASPDEIAEAPQPPPPAPAPPAPAPDEDVAEATSSARDPFAAPLSEPLASMYAQVQRGRPLSRTQVRDARRWARENGSDVRANLVIAHGYTNERSLSWALPEYEAAMASDASVRGAPFMLGDLLEMARSNTLARVAADRIVEWYGSEALGAIDAQLETRLRREEEDRLEALRARILARSP